MSHSYLTSYQPIDDIHISPNQENEDDLSPDYPNIHTVPTSDKIRWNHIEDLDSFFTRVYQYHQQNGFVCMMVNQILDVIKFAFIMIFTVFLASFVNYNVLFKREMIPIEPDHTKITIQDCVKSFSEGWKDMSHTMFLFLIASTIFWLIRILISIVSYFQFCDIKKFYNVALGISDDQLQNVTWSEVQKRLMEVQIEQRMCIHKESLTELDIYHRILRFTNYFIAMVNKGVIPLKLSVPFLGQVMFLTRGLRYNIELILFSGIGAPFKNNWHLDDDYKRMENRHRLAESLSKRILWVGILNFVLMPFIFVFQILRSFYHYTGIIRQEPGVLGLRRWSHYGQVALRHYNELDHELRARLSRGYRYAADYMNSFTSPLGRIVATHLAFMTGAIAAVIFVLTVYDEDVLQVEHVITIMTLAAALTAVFRVLIPPDNLVWCPELLMKKVLAEVHYLPDSWHDKAHTTTVRDEFSQLFQYKMVHLMESLMSPLLTPFLLCFRLRYRSLEMVDFLHNFTVEVVGVGDICSFAQMDLHRHGSKTWHSPAPPSPPLAQPVNARGTATDNGKTELSLLHFALTNPTWRPPQEASQFLNALRSQARKDFDLPALHEENALLSSVTLTGGGHTAYNPLRSRWLGNPTGGSNNVCGPMNRLEGSRVGPLNGVLGSLSQSGNLNFSPNLDAFSPGAGRNPDPIGALPVPDRPQDLIAMDMSVSTLYLHELHQRRRAAAHYTDTPMDFAGAIGHAMGGLRPSTESYYHSTDPPSTEGSLYPSSLHHQPLDEELPHFSQRYHENTPLIKPRT